MAFTGRWRPHGCCGSKDPSNLPQNQTNLIIFDLMGFNYRVLPEWYNETGQRMLPLTFSVNSDMMKYRWTFSKPTNVDICRMRFYLTTSDDIVPIIYEKVSGRKLKVQRFEIFNGYTTWIVGC